MSNKTYTFGSLGLATPNATIGLADLAGSQSVREAMVAWEQDQMRNARRGVDWEVEAINAAKYGQMMNEMMRRQAEAAEAALGLAPIWLRRDAVTVTEEPVPAEQPIPESAQKAAPADFDAEYAAVAKELGITSAPITEAEFLQFFHAEGIGCYEFAKVDAFLKGKAAAESKKDGKRIWTWCWKPLRTADHGKLPALNAPAAGAINSEVYKHAVPLPVLLTVKKILGKFANALFFVSDYTAHVPDPFLMVTTKELWDAGKFFIVERWDDPGFRS